MSDARAAGLDFGSIARGVFSQTPASLVGNGLGLGLIWYFFYGNAPLRSLAVWSIIFALVSAGRLAIYLYFNSGVQAGEIDPRRPLSFWNWGTLCSGAMWGGASWLFYGFGPTDNQVALILIVFSYCVGAIQLLGAQFRIFVGFSLLCFVPMVARVATFDVSHSEGITLVLVIIYLVTFLLAKGYRRAYENLVELKLRSEMLAEQLGREKVAAEAARHEAEVANRAKTQFFAAASHDLRQPLHAMGLFAEALRNKSRDEEVIKLVNSINSSVDALEGLFSELLDITKIDTGAVDVVPQNFGMREMFARLRLHYEPTAFEKGLQLKLRGEQCFAYADPVLVERILRNLISNAIRYTEDGGVLVSCRPRGDRLLLQVWDSGAGIAESEQARIFEEFYQVQPDQPLPAHHRKGLGLGLAIVRRLADLMGAPLSLRSRVGHGTVFTLTVPIGKAVRPAESTISSKPPLGITLDRKLIVVVEDEPAVRDGLEVMLKGWGATVAAFDSVAASQTWADQARQQGLLPDLLIVDFRIDHRTTGIDAITALRERFGKAVPAIVVTGSTTVSLEEEAHEHDFHLLIKPVVPNKLRAMIAFKLGVRGR